MKTTSMALAAVWLSSLAAFCQTNSVKSAVPQTVALNLTANVKQEVLVKPQPKKINPLYLKAAPMSKPVRDMETNAAKKTGVENNNTVTEIKAFPNPFTTQIDVIITDGHMAQSAYKANLYDVNGKRVHAENLTANQSTLKLEHLSAGVYFLYVEKNGTIMKQEKFVKQ
jgi:hypothetical protein